ncbi:MAG: hypothetical protein M5R37_14150 [Melioribacteraceae bacterium]|nr:hypothetical protein [Melioribacteraceae bacterium]
MKNDKKGNMSIISSVFDEVMNSFIEDQDIIIEDESERAKLRFQDRKRKLKIWANSKKCMFHGCEKNSIPNSHTIQKKGSLQIISESGHLLTPTFNPNVERISLEKTGVKKASTFPGFCKQHESIFSSFENKTEFQNDKDVRLQIFRTISRELIVKQLHLIHFKKMKESYIDFRNKKLMSHFEEKIGNKFIKENNIQLKSLSFNNIDDRERMLNEQIHEITDDIKDFNKDFYNAICNDLEIGNENELSIIGYNIEFQIPVCLAGRGNFHFKDGDIVINVDAVLLVLPFEDYTLVFGATPQRNKDYLIKYLDMFTQHSLLLLTMIEGWMLYGSDHWFLKPSIWDKITPVIQMDIAKSIANIEKDIGHPCDISIFNELRKIILNDLEEYNFENLQQSFKEFIAKEKEKLKKSYKLGVK